MVFHSVCSGVLPASMYVCHTYGVPRGQKRVLDPLGTRIIDSCEPPCRCWESNGFSVKATSVLNFGANSTSPHY